MPPKALTLHACEQVLRFTRVAAWDDLSEERKVQLGFNLGIVALGLGLSKAEGYDAMAQTRMGTLSMPALHAHLRQLVAQHHVLVNESQIARDF